MLSPDQQRLVRIWDYCNSIGRSIQRFGSSWESFYADMDYQYVIAFSILQIGELVSKLSPAFRDETIDEINWTEINGLRNIVVHDYGKIKPSIVWNIVTEDIPVLKQFCERHLPEEF